MTAPEKEQPSHNAVFSRLVDSASTDSDRLIGMVAYAEYKRKKREIILKVEADHKRKPTGDELSVFTGQYENAQNLNNFKAEANQILLDYAHAYSETKIRAARQRATKTAILGEIRSITDDINREHKATVCPELISTVESQISNSLKKAAGFKTGVVASLTATALVFGVATILSIANPETGYAKLFQAVIFNKGVIQLIPHKPIQEKLDPQEKTLSGG